MNPELKNLIDIEVIKKENMNKIWLFIVSSLIVIVLAAISGIVMAKIHNNEILKQYSMNDKQDSLENENLEENNNEENNSKNEDTKTLPLKPIYSEEAKNRMDNIYVSNDEEKVAYLTFDDGPSSAITPQILQILKDNDIKATFFVLGSRAELLPNLVKQEYEEGHYIANHGYSHDYSRVYSSANAVLDEYNVTEKAIRNAIGNEEYTSYIFRFPGGSEGGKYAQVKNDAKNLLSENNICYINWNALTNDAVGTPTAESLIEDLKKTSEGKNKIVVLMHDSGTKQLTADTLPQAISYLKEQGYSFKNFYDIMY